jgi:hydroxypyruvate reductase
VVEVTESSPPRARALLTTLYEAAVAAVAPAPLVSTALADLDARHDQRFWVFAFGKAAPAMAQGAVAALRRSLYTIAGGVVVGAEPSASPFSTIRSALGDHPLPGNDSFAAAQLIADVVPAIRGDDAAVVLVSGGTTSLIAAPARGAEQRDIERLFVLLMDAGLDIGAMNAVRKRFLRWGAGRLAVALAPARTRVLLLSDVPGDAPEDIGSGPCSPDEWRARELVAMLEDARLLDKLPPSLREYLSSVFRGLSPDTPKAGHPAFAHVSTSVVGSNAFALDAAVNRAKQLGLPAERGPFALSGEASECGERIARALLERASSGRAGCVLWGGETTVQLRGASVAQGTGGRCQELALAAARVLASGGDAARRVTILAAGTDGRDGPTDATGAFADASLWQRIRDAGADPDAALSRHRSYAALDAGGALLRRGPTGTNVMDVVIAVVE